MNQQNDLSAPARKHVMVFFIGACVLFSLLGILDKSNGRPGDQSVGAIFAAGLSDMVLLTLVLSIPLLISVAATLSAHTASKARKPFAFFLSVCASMALTYLVIAYRVNHHAQPGGVLIRTSDIMPVAYFIGFPLIACLLSSLTFALDRIRDQRKLKVIAAVALILVLATVARGYAQSKQIFEENSAHQEKIAAGR